MATKTRTNEPRAMDPQCGRSVPIRKAPSLKWEGKTYYFCSEECKARFRVDPPGDAGF